MKRNTSVNVRMTEDLRASLQRLADANKRTLSDYIRLLLEEHVGTQERTEDATKRKRPAS
jgi:predicted transcriptional regulator